MKKDANEGYSRFLTSIFVGISEVSDITKVPVRKLRYWEEKGIITTVGPTATSRQFDLANVKKIVLIQELIEEGYTFDGAAKKFEERMAKVSSLLSLIEI